MNGDVMDPKVLSDEALAEQAKHSVDAQALLLERYRKLVRYHANRFAATWADAEDLAQEGMIVLLHAVSQFRPESQVPFSAYAQTCIMNKMRSLAAKRKKADVLPPVELSELLEESIQLVDPETPESILLEKEGFADCRMQVMAMLSAQEWEILQCIMAGDSYAKTAERLQITVKSVDNAMQRIRRKMRATQST